MIRLPLELQAAMGMGFARTTAEGLKQLPGVILPELAVGKFAQVQQVSKLALPIEANAGRQLAFMEASIEGAHDTELLQRWNNNWPDQFLG